MATHRGMGTGVTVSSFHLSKSGLRPLGTPTYREWLACGHFIKNTEQSVQFWIGDWLLYGEKRYGKTQYAQAVQQTGLEYQTLRIYKYVAAAIPLSLRRNNVSFHHYKEVANLPQAIQTQLLRSAEDQGWPVIKLKQEKYRLTLEAARTAPAPADAGFFLGDCVQLLPDLPDESIDLVLTAPHFETTGVSHIEKALTLLEKKLKLNSHIYLFTSWKTYPALLPVMQHIFTVKNLLVWEKNMPSLAEKTSYSQTYECILFAQKGRRHLIGRRDASLLRFDAIPDALLSSPTEKPLPLLEYFIEKSSLPGEVVCDPFAGVASTCVAAKNTGRKYLGFEKEKQWFDLGRQRF